MSRQCLYVKVTEQGRYYGYAADSMLFRSIASTNDGLFSSGRVTAASVLFCALLSAVMHSHTFKCTLTRGPLSPRALTTSARS